MENDMRLGDYLDVEWFLEKDRVEDPVKNLERDRCFGLQAAALGVRSGELALFWLQRRRERSGGLLPSAVLATGLSVLRLLLAVFGLIAGVSLVRALLLYSGTDPVNVSVFLLAAVLPQAALCLAAAVLLVLRWAGVGAPHIPLRPLFALAWRPCGRLSPHAGFVRALMLGRGWPAAMMAWECLGLLHLAGFALALGALGATLVSVTVTDLAFGWQSTLQVGARGMHAVVASLAAPWGWLPGHWGLAPDLAQIEGSRIVLKDGISTLASADLASWWPFLCMCLLAYALLPRLGLLALSRIFLRRAERRFVHPDLGRIADRMSAPLLGTVPGQEPQSGPLPLVDGVRVADEATTEGRVTDAAAGCVLLLPPELEGRIPGKDLEALVMRVGGHPLSRVLPVPLLEEDVTRALGQCSGLAWRGGLERFVVLVEAWQPPIRESLQALHSLGAGGGKRSLTLVLCGRPSGGNWLTAPAVGDLEAWSGAVESLAPQRMEIFGAQS